MNLEVVYYAKQLRILCWNHGTFYIYHSSALTSKVFDLMQFGSGDTFSALLLGFAALWTLYFTIAVVNAMDSVPLVWIYSHLVGALLFASI